MAIVADVVLLKDLWKASLHMLFHPFCVFGKLSQVLSPVFIRDLAPFETDICQFLSEHSFRYFGISCFLF